MAAMSAAASRPEQEDADAPPAQSRAPQWIEDGLTINRLLNRAAEQRLVLAVAGLGEARNSLLLAADLPRREIWIDPPFPEPAEPPPPQTALSLSTRIDGAALDFSSTLLSLEPLGDQPALRLRWPERVRHLQRRSHFRLGIPHELKVPPAVIRDHQRVVAATLVDLSRSGAGAMVPRSSRVEAGGTVACTFRIDGLEFSAAAEVRSCVASLDRLRLGLLFGTITPTDAQRLSAAVARLERAVLRSQASRRERLRSGS